MKLIKISLLLISTLLFASCSPENKESSLSVATSADNPPYEFIQDGGIVGLDIDVANAIGEKLNKKIIIKNLEFNGLLAALSSKTVDFVIAGISVTPERQKTVDFSEVYHSAKIAVLFRLADNLTALQDLAEKTVGAQLGSTWEKIALELPAELNIRVHSLSNNLMLIEELKSKAIDAIIFEEKQAKRFVINNPEFNYFILDQFNSEMSIAMPLGSELTAEINNAIKILEQDGTLKNIRQKWLGQ